MIKLIDILNEIGDATMAVDYQKTRTKINDYYTLIVYNFKIGEDLYEVDTYVSPIEKGSDNTRMSVSFNMGGYPSTRTNRGVQYQVMSTITQILKDYINEHPELVEIEYEPLKNSSLDDTREKLYKAYVKKNMPDWNYSKNSEYVYITKPGYTPLKSTFQRFFKK
jgi:hypothetical protein